MQIRRLSEEQLNLFRPARIGRLSEKSSLICAQNGQKGSALEQFPAIKSLVLGRFAHVDMGRPSNQTAWLNNREQICFQHSRKPPRSEHVSAMESLALSRFAHVNMVRPSNQTARLKNRDQVCFQHIGKLSRFRIMFRQWNLQTRTSLPHVDLISLEPERLRGLGIPGM